MLRWLAVAAVVVLAGCGGGGAVPREAAAIVDEPKAKAGPADAVEQMFEALNASKSTKPAPVPSQAKRSKEPAPAAREPQVFEAPEEPITSLSRPSKPEDAPIAMKDAGDARPEPSTTANELGGSIAGAPPARSTLSKPVAVAAVQPATASAPPSTQPPIQTDAALRITSLVACSRIEAFGRYISMDLSRVPMGRAQPMLLYTEVEGFAHRTAAGLPPPPGAETLVDDGSTEWVVHLTQKVTIRRNDQVGTLVKLYEEQAARDIARRRRRDHYLVQRITLPATLAPGQYVIIAEVLDTATGQAAQKQVPFTVVGK